MFQSIANFGLHFVPSFQPPKLSLIYVDDLVELLLRAADHGQRIPDPRKPSAAPGEGYYYAADREHPNYSQLGRMIGVAWGMRSPLILHTSELAGWMIGVTGEWISRWHGVAGPVNRDKIREALASSWAVSGEKATRELSFTPAASLAKRLAETAAWFRSSGWL